MINGWDVQFVLYDAHLVKVDEHFRCDIPTFRFSGIVSIVVACQVIYNFVVDGLQFAVVFSSQC